MLHSVFLFLNIGTPELMLIFFVALLLFGGDKLPGLARTLGRGIRDFKDASEDVKREINKQINSFDEVRENKREEQVPVEEEDAYIERPLIEENQNPEPVNNVDTTTEAESTVAEEAPAEQQEVKKPDFSRPANTIEYKA